MAASASPLSSSSPLPTRGGACAAAPSPDSRSVSLLPLLAIGGALAAAAAIAGLTVRESRALAARLRSPRLPGGRRVATGPLGSDGRPDWEVVDLVNGWRVLRHRRVVHGAERRADGAPGGYLAPDRPLARVLATLPPDVRVALAGLGSGCLLALLPPGATLECHEIDPGIAQAAREHFGFLARHRGPLRLVIGDAALTLLAQGPARFELVVLDAYRGARPVEGVTTGEGVARALTLVEPAGLVAVNLTGAPRGAEHELPAGLLLRDPGDGGGAFASRWLLLGEATRLAELAALVGPGGSRLTAGRTAGD